MNDPELNPVDQSPDETQPAGPGPEKRGDALHGLDPKALIAGGLERPTVRTDWVPPSPSELSRLLPQYEIDALLGRGGMGAVYRGRQVTLDRRVAIKLLPAEIAADPEFVARFQREARTLAKLHHPGIVLVHDFGQTPEGHLYFVMEFVDGTDLHHIIHGPGIDCAQSLEIVAQICDALQYAHSQGVVHRDIKPANILLTKDGRAKLGDFGLARPVDDGSGTFTRSHIIMGTPDYMAPEQLRGDSDHRADLYALGVALYEMLTGRPPRGAWAPPSQRVQVDVRLDQVVIRALQEDPKLRYQQASEIKTDVEAIRSGPLAKFGNRKKPTSPESPGQPGTSLPKAKMPGSKVVWAAAVMVVLLAAVGWWRFASVNRAASGGLGWQRANFAYDYKTVTPGPDGWQKTGLNDKILHLNLSSHEGTYLRLGNAAIRFKMRWAEDNGGALSVFPRYSTDKQQPDGFIEYQLNSDRLVIKKNGNQIMEANLEKPFEIGDEAVIETVSLENDFFFRVNGQVIQFGAAQMRQEGWVIIGGWKAQFKDVEYLDLDGIADPLKALGWEVESVASGPATATKDTPFTNSLGMRFVPVPGTDVLVCIHETRRSDYAAYAAAVPGVDSTWKNPVIEGRPLDQADDHPVLGVSWEDAEAFCAWLSKKEGRNYSLPTQREWNLAAAFGVDEPQSISDDDLRKLLKHQFPWGTADQADAPKYGNYSGKEDGYEGTAPVMSFLPNRLGIYDLGGNSWEWCAEWLSDQHKFRVLRGCNFLNYGGYRNSETRPYFGSNYRLPVPPLNDYSRAWIPGFRCVLLKSLDGSARDDASPEALQLQGANSSFAAFPALTWKPAPIPPTEIAKAAANGGWVAYPRWYAAGFKDGAVRMRYRWTKGAQFSVTLRESPTAKGSKVWLTSDGRVQLQDWDKDPAPSTAVQLPPPDTGDEGTIEFAVVGTDAIARVNGRNLRLTVSTNERGTCVLGNGYIETPTAVKNVEFVDLNEVPDPLRALGWEVPGTEAETGDPWRDFLAELAAGPHKNAQLGQVWTPENGSWRVRHYHAFRIPDEKGRDLALRIAGIMASGKGPAGNPHLLGITLRDYPGKSGYTGILFNTGNACIRLGTKDLKPFPLRPGFDPAIAHSLELRSQGDLLTLLIDGIEVGSVRDSTLPAGGSFGAGASDGGLVEKVEYRFLDPHDTSVSAPPLPTQRQTAERLLSLKAELRIRQTGKQMSLKFGDPLPEAEFSIYEIVFPTTAKATDESFALVAGAPDLHRLLVNGPITTLSPVAGLRKLFELTIYAGGSGGENTLPEEEMRHLKELDELETLNLSYITFSGEGCRHLAGCTKLKGLFLGRNGKIVRPIDEAGAAVIAQLKTVTNLPLRGQVFDPTNASAFRVIAAMPNLVVPT